MLGRSRAFLGAIILVDIKAAYPGMLDDVNAEDF